MGAAQEDTLRFSPEVTFAEYWEFPNQADELRITLASYEASCERYAPPPEGAAAITLSILAPVGQKIEAVEYPALDPEVRGEDPRKPEKAYVLPYARVQSHGLELPPGGSVRLTELDLSPHGSVSGLISLQGAADESATPMRVAGRFSARLCRYSPLPASPIAGGE